MEGAGIEPRTSRPILSNLQATAVAEHLWVFEVLRTVEISHAYLTINCYKIFSLVVATRTSLERVPSKVTALPCAC